MSGHESVFPLATLASLGPGDHACLLYEGDAEPEALLSSYTRCFASMPLPNAVTEDALAAAGPALRAALAAGHVYCHQSRPASAPGGARPRRGLASQRGRARSPLPPPGGDGADGGLLWTGQRRERRQLHQPPDRQAPRLLGGGVGGRPEPLGPVHPPGRPRQSGAGRGEAALGRERLLRDLPLPRPRRPRRLGARPRRGGAR